MALFLAAPLAAPFPPNRFELRGMLGQGGMGRVCLAYDHQLDRLVALKFLHADSHDLESRLLLEARCQGAIRHPNVVPIFDIGLLEGRACLAMAYIEGPNLWEVRKQLGLQDMVSLVVQAARGVHAAHRAGLIHRDLKPQNILVDHSEGPGWRAYVTDFGLARSAGMGEEASSLAGTLAYMSPEQVLGDHLLDARSDVFSLGAVLYALLTDRPPFLEDACPQAPTSSLATEPRLLSRPAGDLVRDAARIMDIVTKDVPRPRSLRKDLPADLETILLHALEREPHRRYPSAKALADDLERFLQGEPVLARRPSLGYRLMRYAARNRAVAWLSMVLFLGLLLAAGVFRALSLRAQARAFLAQQFATQAQQIEHHLRLGHMMPPHDRTPQLAWARARTEEMRIAAQHEGAIALGPFAYLSGTTHLLLDRPQAAKQELERAWRLGFRTPTVALALGEAAFETRLASPYFHESKTGREEDEALTLLRQARQPGTHNPLLESRIALLEGREADAIVQCEAALAQTPWAFESHLQIGQVWLNRLGKADRLDDIRHCLSKAMEHFDRARSMAPSDPKSLLLKARALRLLARRQLQAGRNCEAGPLLQGIALCNEAERLDPSFARVFGERSLLRCVLLLYGTPRQSPDERDREAALMLADGRRGHRLDPDLETCQAALGWAIQTRVELAFRRRMPGSMDVLKEGERELRTNIAAFPSSAPLHKALAYVLWNRMDLEQELGLDPRPTSRELIAIFRHAMRLLSGRELGHGEQVSELRELGERLTYQAELERMWGDGGSARQSLREATEVLDQLRDKEGVMPSYPFLGAWGLLLQARLELEAGHDPAPFVRQAKACLSGRPITGLTDIYNRLPRSLPYELHFIEAEEMRRRGGDPRPAWRRCMEEAERAMARNPKDSYAIYAMTTAAMLDVRRALMLGLDATPSAQRGAHAARRIAATEMDWWPTEPRTGLAGLANRHFELAIARRAKRARLAASLRELLRVRRTAMTASLQRDSGWETWLEREAGQGR